MTQYCWSSNGERYRDSFPTREEALAEGRSFEEEGETIWTAEVDPMPLSKLIDIDQMLDDANERLSGLVSLDSLDDWWEPAISIEAIEDFHRIIDDWATKHRLQPGIHTVKNIVEHKAEDGGEA